MTEFLRSGGLCTTRLEHILTRRQTDLILIRDDALVLEVKLMIFIFFLSSLYCDVPGPHIGGDFVILLLGFFGASEIIGSVKTCPSL